jgi:hypothetical protein
MVVLLFALAGQRGPFISRVPDPIPIARPLTAARDGRLQRAAAWWQAP